MLKGIGEAVNTRIGTSKGYEAIHIKSDWILIFKIEKPLLILAMIGSHPKVYKKLK